MVSIPIKSFFIFDLDDTLYKEFDFVKSGFFYISQILTFGVNQIKVYEKMITAYNRGENAIQAGIDFSENTNHSANDLLRVYREHKPMISLDFETKMVLKWLLKEGFRIGLITDGRSVTQRNKLRALEIENLFSDIIISEEFGSEKPSFKNFEFYEKKYKDYNFYYIGDNTTKDFITPNKLGWNTFCLIDNGLNIHKQNLESLSDKVKMINSIIDIINE